MTKDLHNYNLFCDPERYAVPVTDSFPNQMELKALGIEAACIGQEEKDLSCFLDQIRYNDNLKGKTLVLIFDKGTKEANSNYNKVCEELRNAGREYRPDNSRDTLLERLADDPHANKIKKIIAEAARDHDPAPDNIARYLQKQFRQDLERFQDGADRRTGFPILDSYLHGMTTGLYLLGAETSKGKTTFALQIADNLARAGDHVLYFAMEQSRFELVTKSLSRETYLQAKRQKEEIPDRQILNTVSIRRGQTDKITEQATEYYLQHIAQNMNIIEGGFETTVGTIRKEVEKYIKLNRVRPVIFVDYLQTLQPEAGQKMDERQTIKAAMYELKTISRDYNTAIVLISSTSRANNRKEGATESFLGSSAIEYTADVALHLHTPVTKGDDDEQRRADDEAMKTDVRDMEIKIVKNRNGTSHQTIAYTYYNAHDYFREEERVKPKTTRMI